MKLPPGYVLKWTGQYELLQAMQARMKFLVPLTLLLVLLLLYLNFGSLADRGVGAVWNVPASPSR